MAESLEDSGSKYVDVLDPDTGSMFRFFEVEFAIACGMDGQRDVAGLIAWAREELGLLPTAAEVRNVISRLGELGYLDLGAVAREVAAAPVEPARPVERRSEPVIAKAPAKPVVDDDLAPGIVVGAKASSVLPPAGDVELGHAGPKDRAPAIEAPPVEEFALGAPGVAEAPKLPALPVEEVALGAPGRTAPVATKPDVSLDLSEQVGVGLDDVKEAVRASKVMSAVDVPKDLLDAIAEPVAKPPVVDKPAEKPPVVAKPPVVEKPAEKPPVVAKPAEKAPIVAKQPPKPDKPAEKLPVAPPAPGSRRTTILIVFLVLVLAAFGVYMVWKHVLQKSNSDATKTGTTEQPVTPKPQPTPEPKKPDPIKLAKSTPAAMETKASAANTIEQVTTEKAVKKGQVVIWFTGGKNAQRPVDAAKLALDKAVKEVADLKAQPASPELDKKISDAEKRLIPKKEALDKAQEALDKVSIKALVDGEVTVTAKTGKVAEGDVLFSLTPVPALVATFKETKPDIKADSPVYVAIKGSETKLTCKTTQVDAKSTTVDCPLDAALDGAEVALVGPAPVEPEKPVEKPADPKPVDAKPPAPPAPRPQPRPVQPKPADPKPADPKPADPKPADPPADPPPATP